MRIIKRILAALLQRHDPVLGKNQALRLMLKKAGRS